MSPLLVALLSPAVAQEAPLSIVDQFDFAVRREELLAAEGRYAELATLEAPGGLPFDAEGQAALFAAVDGIDDPVAAIGALFPVLMAANRLVRPYLSAVDADEDRYAELAAAQSLMLTLILRSQARFDAFLETFPEGGERMKRAEGLEMIYRGMAEQLLGSLYIQLRPQRAGSAVTAEWLATLRTRAPDFAGRVSSATLGQMAAVARMHAPLHPDLAGSIDAFVTTLDELGALETAVPLPQEVPLADGGWRWTHRDPVGSPDWQTVTSTSGGFSVEMPGPVHDVRNRAFGTDGEVLHHSLSASADGLSWTASCSVRLDGTELPGWLEQTRLALSTVGKVKARRGGLEFTGPTAQLRAEQIGACACQLQVEPETDGVAIDRKAAKRFFTSLADTPGGCGE